MPENRSLDALADQLNDPDLSTLLRNIHREVYHHADTVGRITKTDILTSRFLPAQDAYDRGIISCGVMANIAAHILRRLGYEVRLVHGSIPETPTHAWIAIKNTEQKTWDQYDLTRKNAYVGPDHHMEYIVDDWEAIRPEIQGIYDRNHAKEE